MASSAAINSENSVVLIESYIIKFIKDILFKYSIKKEKNLFDSDR